MEKRVADSESLLRFLFILRIRTRCLLLDLVARAYSTSGTCCPVQYSGVHQRSAQGMVSVPTSFTMVSAIPVNLQISLAIEQRCQ